MDSNYYTSDGYRYGVMFSDGSVLNKWSGSTQRARALADLARLLSLYPGDNITLARCNASTQWARCE